MNTYLHAWHRYGNGKAGVPMNMRACGLLQRSHASTCMSNLYTIKNYLEKGLEESDS